MEKEIVKVGPFTWRRDDDPGAECWTLVTPPGLAMTYWCVKNYGGKPNEENGFSGWRLVSGGPFTDAGGWTTREDAMVGVIPYLVQWYRREVAKLQSDYKAAKKALDKFKATMSTHGYRL